MGPLVQDARWVRQSFLVNEQDLAKVDQQNRIFTSASLKFVDTAPGGNFAINPPPQFTRYCDVRVPGRYARNQESGHASGLGRYYSEAIDDNQQIIYMRFGVPQYNSLTTFFTGFYNTGAGQLARTGRATGAFYLLGRAAGFVVSIMSWKILAVHLLGVGLRFAMNKPSSKFYYLKPAMPLYWNAVNTMVNHIAVNRGIVPRFGGADSQKLDGGYEFNDAAIQRLSALMPDIFKGKGGVDVYAIANRAMRLARKHQKLMEQALDTSGGLSNADLSARIQQVEQQTLSDNDGANYATYLQKWTATSVSQPKAGTAAPTDEVPTTPTDQQHWWDKLGEFFEAELDDGSAFASFRVNATGPIGESFSNNVTESEIANKINSMSSSARSTNFTFAGGNLVGGAIGTVVGSVMGAIKDVVAGAADSLSISGLAALGGAAFVDIPKHWESSQAQLPRASYTIQLVSPYGNPISQLLNLYIPLCMLLAGALPLSTGKQSYTSPFLCELYDRGRCQTRLGMIDSLSITRGTGNFGFDNEGHPMAIDVSFSVVDMSSVLHMPIAEGIDFGNLAAGAIAGGLAGGATGAVAGAAAASGIFDDDTVFTDYMAILSGMGLADQIYSLRKLKLSITQKMTAWDSHFSLSHAANWAADTWPGRLASVFYKGTQR